MFSTKKSLLAIVLGAGLLLPPFAAGRSGQLTLVQTLAGRYSHHFQNNMMDGEKYGSDDVVEIVPVANNAAYVRVSLQFENAHTCDISGVATAERDQLVYHQPLPPSFLSPAPSSLDTTHPCILRLSRVGSKLQLDDSLGSCHDQNCGMHGTLTGALPFNSKRPITYMPLLQASKEYSQAMAEWHGNH